LPTLRFWDATVNARRAGVRRDDATPSLPVAPVKFRPLYAEIRAHDFLPNNKNAGGIHDKFI
jgi:hypothetical protein